MQYFMFGKSPVDNLFIIFRCVAAQQAVEILIDRSNHIKRHPACSQDF